MTFSFAALGVPYHFLFTVAGSTARRTGFRREATSLQRVQASPQSAGNDHVNQQAAFRVASQGRDEGVVEAMT